MLATVLFVVSVVSPGLAYPSGAPPQACVTQIPGHLTRNGSAIVAQDSTSPYAIYINATQYQRKSIIKVTINGTQTFQGFLLQARHATGVDFENVGSFAYHSPANITKTVQCNNQSDSVTHTQGDPLIGMTSMNATWIAPDEDIGSIFFMATVLHDHDTFWLGQKSVVVIFNETMSTSSAALATTKSIPTTTTAMEMTTSSDIPTTTILMTTTVEMTTTSDVTETTTTVPMTTTVGTSSTSVPMTSLNHSMTSSNVTDMAVGSTTSPRSTHMASTSGTVMANTTPQTSAPDNGADVSRSMWLLQISHILIVYFVTRLALL